MYQNAHMKARKMVKKLRIFTTLLAVFNMKNRGRLVSGVAIFATFNLGPIF